MRQYTRGPPASSLLLTGKNNAWAPPHCSICNSSGRVGNDLRYCCSPAALYRRFGGVLESLWDINCSMRIRVQFC